MSLLAPREHRVIRARTRTIQNAVGPLSYDCVKVIVVRDGSAILYSEFGQQPVRTGDVIRLFTDEGVGAGGAAVSG
jgi:AraC family transcriptional regulator